MRRVVLADYPCDWHLSRYKGPSTRVYLNVFREDMEIRLKGSCCPTDFEALVDLWLSKALVETADGSWDPQDEAQELEALWKPSRKPLEARFGRRTA